MATKMKNQKKAKKSPHDAKSSDRRTTIERRDINEDEQHQITNSGRENEDDIASGEVQNFNLTSQEDGDAAGETRERQEQMQEDNNEHEGKEKV